MVRMSLFMYFLFSTYSIMGFFLPPYLQSNGLDSGQIGNLLAVGSLVAMIAQPAWGFISDKHKTVKPILLVLLICAFSVSLGFFSATSFFAILFFYALFSCFHSATGPLAETLCIAYASQHQKSFGQIRLWGEVGVGMSSLLLGIVIDRIGIHHLGGIYALAVCVAGAATLLLPNSKSAASAVNLSNLGKLFVKPKLLWFLLLVLMVGIPHRMNDSMLAIYLHRLGATDTQLGMAWLVATFSTVPVFMFISKIMRKWNELGILVIAAFAYSLRWMIYSFAESPGVLIAAQLLHSLTFPLFLVSSIQYLSSIVPAELRASGQAAFAVTFGGLGGIIGSSTGGYAMAQLGPQPTYLAGSLLALAGAAAIIATYKFGQRNSRRGQSAVIKPADNESL
ncbi:MFS transporter [Paenibacillus sp. H1-7]|uniref:MFS transporter n=1 Tax=Paenibacillus sp. H1-7 TaxID=2282849 RepID=UPI001EF79332|nr:MFS transporter [Paenibacillus sp. H1-7]ULL16105.1 MFS transporter [Paenibacillus sp. H1-7]